MAPGNDLKQPGPWWGVWAQLLAIVFLLNFFWESWHGSWLYRWHFTAGLFAQMSVQSFVKLITYAAVIDTLVFCLLLAVGTWLWRDPDWVQTLNRRKVCLVVGLALAAALVIEFKAVFLWQQWQYDPLMPTIFGVGVSPLLQLPVTFLAALVILAVRQRSGGVN